MRKLAYKLTDAAREMDVDEKILASLRDSGQLITYRIGRDEYVTDYALRDLQHRLEVGLELPRGI